MRGDQFEENPERSSTKQYLEWPRTIHFERKNIHAFAGEAYTEKQAS